VTPNARAGDELLRRPRVVAIIAAHNEADVIRAVVADLIGQGVQVYLLDDRSTDGTREAVREFLGRGLLRIERFPDESGYPSDPTAFAWSDVLRRKVEIADGLDADWFIHHDADEFRESPWDGLSLPEAIARVERLGFNAIDFEVLNFVPTPSDRFEPGTDVRDALTHYEQVAVWDKRQIKCWRRQPRGAVDLESSGGHEAEFAGRRVFPLRFILRHYPVRSQAHGERKVFRERVGRFLPEERARGWHVQYDGFTEGAIFTRDASTLKCFDSEEVRLSLVLRHRGVEEIEQRMRQELDRLTDRTAQLERVVEPLRAALQAADDELARLRVMLPALRLELESAQAEVRVREAEMVRRDAEADRLRAGLADYLARANDLGAHLTRLQLAIDAMRASTSWRLTRPLRALSNLLRRKR
jgi:hypothetical protein